MVVQQEVFDERHEQLLSLEREGHLFRCASSDAAAIFGRVLIELSDELRKFAINSIVDTLPHKCQPPAMAEEER